MADAINDFQYRRAKMATNSDMFVNMGIKFIFERNTSTNTGDLENCTLN